MSLRTKSIHDLRTIAQSFGVKDLLSKDAAHLIQEIELKQEAMLPPPKIEIPKPEYDARLMTKPPARLSNEDSVRDLLKPYTDIGMHLSFPDPERWAISHGKKNDTGNLRMPLRAILRCAERLMK